MANVDCCQFFCSVFLLWKEHKNEKSEELLLFFYFLFLIVRDACFDFNHFSFAYLLQIFNDKLLKFHVKRCIGAAIKLRKKYFYKVSNNIFLGIMIQRWHINSTLLCYFAVNPENFCFFLLLSLSNDNAKALSYWKL